MESHIDTYKFEDGVMVPVQQINSKVDNREEIEEAIQKETPRWQVKKNSYYEWNDTETKFLLERHTKYLPHVGLHQKFHKKKDMWDCISKEIKEEFGNNPSGPQCETRYKTVMKRKSFVTNINKKTGESPVDSPFEEEIENIKSIDDSIEPEMLRSVGNVQYIKRKQDFDIVQEEQNNSLHKKRCSNAEMLIKQLKRMETQRERHHQEKMQLFRDIFSLPQPGCSND